MYLTQSLHRAVQLHPDRVASRFGHRTQTFREMAQRVARLAGALQRLGLQPGDRVGMLALNSDRYLEYLMAVPWAGGVLNPCNVRWSVAENRYALEDSGTRILLVDEGFKEAAAALMTDGALLREVVYVGEGDVPSGMHGYEALLAAAEPVPDQLRRGDELAGIFYTGGTTGFPKGVMLSHNNLVSSGLQARAEGLATPGGSYLHVAPMFHLADIGLAQAHWIEGNTHVVLPAFHPEQVLDCIERDRVTHVLLVPTMIQMLVDHPAASAGTRDLGSLQQVVYGASPISEAVLRRAFAVLPGVRFAQAYGMTELSPVATVLSSFHHSEEGQKLGKLRSAGRASYCCEVRVVDESDHEVPRGTVGEVVVRGPVVMQGYWKQPRQTEAAIRDGWMHTGDGGYMDADGFVFIVDRMKDMIISGGENVFSIEVENALAKHPAVAACAVIGVPSEQWGEAVHAVVVLKAGQAASAEALQAHAKGLIAGYKCPRSVEFRESLPLSGAGKVLKARLREPFWQGRGRQVA
ncbi:MAG: long-chain-fatty-acid--CoA ligase [Curvibacter sp.]|nr:long-chain-fatty-acid--CoA ligase [Curvibacter sp.]